MTHVIDLAALRSRLQANPKLVLLEALPASYFATGHLPGARHLPHDAPDSALGTVLADRDAEIVTYCASTTCPNSHLLAERLIRAGYRNVSVFGPGKAAWLEAGLSLAR
ncbi:MAG TPA: rhodanese-like domain-containing protein [Opitutaceae bacterium]|nr:rhodanese-like domain-containing protein [Opitutaceae bacterium]